MASHVRDHLPVSQTVMVDHGSTASQLTHEKWGELTSEAIFAVALAAAPRAAALRHPLFRRVYLIFFILLSLFVLVPAWAVLYIPKRYRPRETWTLQRCLRVRWSRRLCAVVARCEIDYLGRELSLDLDPATLTHSHPVTIPPAPLKYLRGHPAETLAQLHASRGKWHPHLVHRIHRDRPGAWGRWNHEPERTRIYGMSTVKAFWYTGKKIRPTDGPRARRPGQPVALHFHGGGYLCGTAAESDTTSNIPKSLVDYSPVHHVLSVDYRLAPAAPWPLPLLDAISAYHYLVHHERVPERDIVVGGDSAGGHLAIALTRYLRDEGRALGLTGPRGLVVMSPWVDVGFTNAWGDGMYHNADSDTIDDTFGPFASSLLLRALPPTTMHTSPYLSPAGLLIPTAPTGPNSLESFPPTYIIYGGAERLARSIEIFWTRLRLARKAEAVLGRRPVLVDRIVQCPDAVHDFMIFPWMSEEAAEMYEGLDTWLRELLAGSAEEDDNDEVAGSPEEMRSPDWKDIALKRRVSRRMSRASLRVEKSPLMGPTKDEQGVMRLMTDMRSEGMSYIDLPPLDLDNLPLPMADAAREWITPFTAQLEPGEWDWEQRGRSWYELPDEAEPNENVSGSRSGTGSVSSDEDIYDSPDDLEDLDLGEPALDLDGEVPVEDRKTR